MALKSVVFPYSFEVVKTYKKNTIKQNKTSVFRDVLYYGKKPTSNIINTHHTNGWKRLCPPKYSVSVLLFSFSSYLRTFKYPYLGRMI